ncbi:MAG: hypothetical protein Q8N51_16595 [Gammaproteobacteria bacterium]|nr:hypothetical protein [Gammaproteobacteria bacterium]
MTNVVSRVLMAAIFATLLTSQTATAAVVSWQPATCHANAFYQHGLNQYSGYSYSEYTAGSINASAAVSDGNPLYSVSVSANCNGSQSDTGIALNGSLSSSASSSGWYANAIPEVITTGYEFTIDALAEVTVTGHVFSDQGVDGLGIEDRISWSVYLIKDCTYYVDSACNFLHDYNDIDEPNLSFARTVILDPGHYRFDALLRGRELATNVLYEQSGTGSMSAEFGVMLTIQSAVVPIPAAAWLCARRDGVAAT